MKNATPKPGRPGEVSQWPRWEGPEESRPAGYLPAERNAGTRSGDSREKTRDDALIADQVAAQLEQNPFLDPRSVSVSVEHRRVVLAGVVDTPEASLRAERDALSIEGVYACENRLEVGASESGRLRDG
ncbi:BON domain-containing protein [Ciceribacter ferrooxidans]|uniref:BON domain-containing protein n=1 Tax=Ciceribacter ferrooxidans TaxID=2509717 RepID=A0A4Q2SH15_9HYPH|nr:BON domain-containing protein [Ciceribacter ferrooxidans]